MLSKTSNNEEIKRYFLSILNLSQSKEEFPVNLDEVWSLVYERKDYAVKALRENFIENVDFQPFRQKAERSENGKFTRGNTVEYFLSVSCLEYFIARKVRPVFEVYRQVFHKSVTTPVLMLPQSYSEALRELADKTDENERLRLQVTKQEPLVHFAKSIEHSYDCISVAEMAQILKQNGLGNFGQNRFYEWLRFSGYLNLRGSRRNLPTQKSIESGVMRVAEYTTKDDLWINRKAVITGYGQRYFVQIFREAKESRNYKYPLFNK